MKYLKSHRIYERFGRQMMVLLNKLREAFEDTEFAVSLVDDDYVSIGVRSALPSSVYYDWYIDDFNEDGVKSTVQDHQGIEYPRRVSQEVKDNYTKIDSIILGALQGHVDKPVEWWDQYVDSNVASSKLYDIIEKNLTTHPNWIMKPNQVQEFFQDVIDDIDEDRYSWEFEIGMIYQSKISWFYKLDFSFKLDLNKPDYAKSLTDFGILLASVHRACKRIEQEENIYTFVDVTSESHGINYQTQKIQARIYSKRELIHGKIIDFNYTDETNGRYDHWRNNINNV